MALRPSMLLLWCPPPFRLCFTICFQRTKYFHPKVRWVWEAFRLKVVAVCTPCFQDCVSSNHRGIAVATCPSTGLQYQVWKVPGDSKNVGEKWEDLYQAVQHEEPCRHLFEGLKKSALKTQLEKMVNICSSEGTQAQRESGGGTDGTEEESNETEEEKQTAADLVSEEEALERVESFWIRLFTSPVSNVAPSVF